MDTVSHDPSAETPAPSRCPVDHRASAATADTPEAGSPTGVCPIPHATGPVHRTKADLFMRKLLRVKERPAHVTNAQVYAGFQKSMLISATRCTLTYVVFPLLLPLLALSPRVGGVIGIVVGSVALVSDGYTVRRFFVADHKYRWYFTAVAGAVMCLLIWLLVEDIATLVS